MRVPGVRFVQGRNRYGTSTKYGMAVHCTENDASARNEAGYAQRRTDGVSAHGYIDDVEVIQSLDTDDIAGHAGSDEGNRYAVAWEFVGKSSWSRKQWLDNIAWDKAGPAMAAVCRAKGIPVTRATVKAMKASAKAGGFYTHNDMRLAWGGTDHTDPGPNFPMDHLLKVVAAALNGDDMALTKDDVTDAVWGASAGKDDAGKPITTFTVLGQARAEARAANARSAALEAKFDLFVAEERKDDEAQRKAAAYLKDAVDAYAEAERDLDELRHAQVLAAIDADAPAA